MTWNSQGGEIMLAQPGTENVTCLTNPSTSASIVPDLIIVGMFHESMRYLYRDEKTCN